VAEALKQLLDLGPSFRAERESIQPVAEERYERQVVRIALLAGDNGLIRDATFHRCDIKGPAVVVPLGKTVFEHTRVDGDEDAIWWETRPGRDRVIGAIALQDCTVTDCHLMNVGIAGPREMLRAFRS
jgi:hypothetical protein